MSNGPGTDPSSVVVVFVLALLPEAALLSTGAKPLAVATRRKSSASAIGGD